MSFDIDELLKLAVSDRASDLHISVNSPPIFRIDGELHRHGEARLTETDTEIIAKKLLGEQNWSVFNETGEFDTAYALADAARFRINVFKQNRTVSVAARVIPTHIPTIEELNMPPILNSLAMKPNGLILVTGPTGSGKSTTLAAMIDYVNRHVKKHIITLEDPIEYFHAHKQSIIQQREIGIDTERFSSGLRASLRQDPDIILVGEMRDLETMTTAITAAETGHLVLATLHTNSAAQTINRIIDVFPPHQQEQIRIQLASVLEAVISQRLFKRKDGPGRIAATEILLGVPAVANLIRNEKVDQLNNVLQTSKSQGMHTLDMSINQLIANGEISSEQAKDYLGTKRY